MLLLKTAKPAFGIDCASPFGIKADVLLQLAGLDAAHAFINPVAGPKKKVPVLHDGDTVVPDTFFIQRHLETAHGADFDGWLTNAQRAQAELLRRTIEEFLYFAQGLCRWQDHPETVRDELFDEIPPLLRGLVFGMVRRQVMRDLWGQGLGRHSREELETLTLGSWHAIAEVLGEHPYLMGDQPCSVDASLYGLLVNVLAPRTPSGQTDQVRQFPNLVAYQQRLQAQFGTGIQQVEPAQAAAK